MTKAHILDFPQIGAQRELQLFEAIKAAQSAAPYVFCGWVRKGLLMIRFLIVWTCLNGYYPSIWRFSISLNISIEWLQFDEPARVSSLPTGMANSR